MIISKDRIEQGERRRSAGVCLIIKHSAHIAYAAPNEESSQRVDIQRAEVIIEPARGCQIGNADWHVTFKTKATFGYLDVDIAESADRIQASKNLCPCFQFRAPGANRTCYRQAKRCARIRSQNVGLVNSNNAAVNKFLVPGG